MRKMIKGLVLATTISYLTIAFAWYCIFTYQFTFKATINVGGETLQKEFKGFELWVLCLIWIFIFPPAITQMIKKNKEE